MICIGRIQIMIILWMIIMMMIQLSRFHVVTAFTITTQRPILRNYNTLLQQQQQQSHRSSSNSSRRRCIQPQRIMTPTTTTTTQIHQLPPTQQHSNEMVDTKNDSKSLTTTSTSTTTTSTNGMTTTTTASSTTILDSYWGPRCILLICAAIYSTNFALGSYMNDVLPASAVTACRMTCATITLLPFVSQIQSKFILPSIITGCCAALGYVSQSMALMDTDPARVSFLGAATVVWLPILEATFDRVPMGIKDAPQTWIAALLCIIGVGILELYDPTTMAATTTMIAAAAGGGGSSADGGSIITHMMAMVSNIHTGDLLALLQAIGFGTGAYLSSKLVREEPDQVLSITSILITTTAILSWIWCFSTGSTSSLISLLQSDPIHNNLPIVFAVLWTGIVSTSINYVVEIAALGRVPPAEASVLLASEPIWAALFAALLIGDTLGTNDYIGGSCIVAACLVNALLKPQDIMTIVSFGSNGRRNNNNNNKDDSHINNNNNNNDDDDTTTPQ